ncbi:MAG: hypothetical protein J0I66_09725, partial [Microbacterium sp.]|nr:hypothetical protein [Microbacterium sp.]
MTGADAPTGAPCHRRAAEPVDLALEARLNLQQRVAQRLALDEVVRQLIERSVEVIVDAHIVLVDADEDFPLQPMIGVIDETGALADPQMRPARIGQQLVGDRYGLVEHEQEAPDRRIEHQEKPDAGIVEYRPDELLSRRDRRRRRLDVGQIVEREQHALVLVGEPVEK